MICGLSCGFAGRGSGRLRDCGAPVLTVLTPASGTVVTKPQPPTVSHDGGRADRPGARMPRCTPAGFHHAASAADLSKLRQPARNDGARRPLFGAQDINRFRYRQGRSCMATLQSEAAVAVIAPR